MININLLPPEIKAKINRKKQAANIFSICLVVVIIIIVVSAIFNVFQETIFKSRLDGLQNDIKKSESDLANYKDIEKQAAFLNNRSQLATQIEQDKPNWSVILLDLINSVPSNVKTDSLSVDLTKTPNFVLEAVTTNEREAIKFKEKLESSKFFKDVAFKSASITTSDQANPDAPEQLNFNLEFNLEEKK